MNTNSNTYTVIYSIILVVVVAAVLAFAAMFLKPTQDANVKKDTIGQILTAATFAGVADADILDTYKEVIPTDDATINTESPAWAVDRYSILSLKIYHMQEEVNRTDVDAEHIAKCQAKLDVLNEQYKDMTTSIGQLLDDIAAGRKYMKVYRQMKMYNDPALNPVHYGTKK